MLSPDIDPLVDLMKFLEPIHLQSCEQFESALVAWEKVSNLANSARIDYLREQAVRVILDAQIARMSNPQEAALALTVQLEALIQQARKKQKKKIERYGLNLVKLDAVRQPTTAFQNQLGHRSLAPEEWPRRSVWSVVNVDLVAYQPLTNLYRQAPEKIALQNMISLTQQLRDTFWAACQDVAEMVAGPSRPNPEFCRYRDEDMGDGCIYVFASAEHACQFAVRVHRRAAEYNLRECPNPYQLPYCWWFRIGVETGNLTFTLGGGRNGVNSATGNALIGAARIVPEANPGEILINPATFDALPDSELKRQFASTREVRDKHDLPPRLVHVWVVDQNAPTDFRRSGRGAPLP